jgi:hypothetical protein
MEQVKEAFSKVKKDMDSLKEEVSILNKGLIETRESLVEICEVLKSLSRKIDDKEKTESPQKQVPPKNESNLIPTDNPTHPAQVPTDTRQIPAYPAHNIPQKPLSTQNMGISTGNEGVPTDRQTNQQTNQQTDKGSYNTDISLDHLSKGNLFSSENSINNAAQILDSLDNLKKEIRLKFKRLTDQEFLVFSTIYQLSDEMGYTDYKNLSEKLNLTESSIRDYVGRLIKKGIPLEKVKINNKTIHILISQNLKKIATLPTILQLRAI